MKNREWRRGSQLRVCRDVNPECVFLSEPSWRDQCLSHVSMLMNRFTDGHAGACLKETILSIEKLRGLKEKSHPMSRPSISTPFIFETFETTTCWIYIFCFPTALLRSNKNVHGDTCSMSLNLFFPLWPFAYHDWVCASICAKLIPPKPCGRGRPFHFFSFHCYTFSFMPFLFLFCLSCFFF